MLLCVQAVSCFEAVVFVLPVKLFIAKSSVCLTAVEPNVLYSTEIVSMRYSL